MPAKPEAGRERHVHREHTTACGCRCDGEGPGVHDCPACVQQADALVLADALAGAVDRSQEQHECIFCGHDLDDHHVDCELRAYRAARAVAGEASE